MLLIRPDLVSPGIQGAHGSYTRNANGTIEATHPADILAALSCGYVPVQCMPGLVSIPGSTRFEFHATHNQLLPAVFGGAL
jgi:hypothetical protein